jgi:aldehyde dehydrogenase (NAD+)
VIDKVADEFVDRISKRAQSMRLGDGMDPKTDIGPSVDKGQFKTVLEYLNVGREDGATMVCGGEPATGNGLDKGFFVKPTVFDHVTPDMRIAREEIFGPVLAAIEFADLDEAIARANESSYGLAAAVWTRDIKKAHHVARRLQAGTVWINTYNVYDTAAPFGGYKQSGFGREMSVHALEHYTQVKSVWVDMNL